LAKGCGQTGDISLSRVALHLALGNPTIPQDWADFLRRARWKAHNKDPL